MNLTLESFFDHGSYGGVLRVAGAAFDVVRLLPGGPGLEWNPARETPIDALLQSGRFEEMLADLAARAGSATSLAEGHGLRPAAPVVRPGKVLALGRTYREHALELGNAPPAEPVVFEKLTDGIVGTGATVAIPAYGAGRMEHEAELALVIGKRAWRLPPGNGRGVIAGITIANDLTLRGVQKAAQKAGLPWLAAKSFPGSCALGPVLAPLEPHADLGGLEIRCSVNGDLRQHASTKSLMRPPSSLVEWLSQWIPLNPGDVVLTGTPAGTGPLVPGDVCEITITGDQVDLGKLVTRIG